MIHLISASQVARAKEMSHCLAFLLLSVMSILVITLQVLSRSLTYLISIGSGDYNVDIFFWEPLFGHYKDFKEASFIQKSNFIFYSFSTSWTSLNRSW
jgi:hypothetical protein